MRLQSPKHKFKNKNDASCLDGIFIFIIRFMLLAISFVCILYELILHEITIMVMLENFVPDYYI